MEYCCFCRENQRKGIIIVGQVPSRRQLQAMGASLPWASFVSAESPASWRRTEKTFDLGLCCLLFSCVLCLHTMQGSHGQWSVPALGVAKAWSRALNAQLIRHRSLACFPCPCHTLGDTLLASASFQGLPWTSLHLQTIIPRRCWLSGTFTWVPSAGGPRPGGTIRERERESRETPAQL